MELNAPTAPVTSGLLVRKMITGQLQLADARFDARAPAAVPIAGDGTNTFPLYHDLASGAALDTAVAIEVPVTLLLTPQGARTATPPQAAQTTIALLDTATGHGLPKVFADFRARRCRECRPRVTDPFGADVTIAGTVWRILIQAFERRVLTDNPANAPPFQVEFGNVGQQYYRWRYGDGFPP